MLIEKGVLVDEIKLYGENEDDEALDIEESFSELEDVIEKVCKNFHYSLPDHKRNILGIFPFSNLYY